MSIASRSVAAAAAVAAALALAAAGCSSPPAGVRAPAEEEIWALETAYWEANRSADPDRIAALWHEAFLGWPGTEAKPIGKEEGRPYAARSFPRPAAFDFAIERAGIRVHGDVAVNHYAVVLTPADGSPRRLLRITHTWIREGGAWKMLGGMSWSPT